MLRHIDGMLTRYTRPLGLAAVTAALGLAAAAPGAFAKHGADDPAGHDRGDDHGGRVTVRDDKRHHRHHHKAHAARHGRHHGGSDDGPNHT